MNQECNNCTRHSHNTMSHCPYKWVINGKSVIVVPENNKCKKFEIVKTTEKAEQLSLF